MNKYKNALQQTIARHQELEEHIEELCRKIGLFAITQRTSDIPEILKPLVDEHTALQEEIASHNQHIDQMESLDRKQHEIREVMQTLQSERDELYHALPEIYEKLGATAFQRFVAFPTGNEQYSQIFEELATYEDRMRKLESPAPEDEPAEKNLLKKISNLGKSAYRHTRRSAQEARLPGLLRRAGENIARGGYLEDSQDQELVIAGEPYQETQHRIDAIQEELQSLESESKQLMDSFNALSEGQKLKGARERHIEAIRDREKRSQELCVSLGAAIHDEHETFPIPEDLMAAITQKKEERAIVEDRQRRLEAGLEAQDVESHLTRCRKNQKNAAEEVERLQQHLQSLKDEESRLTAHLEGLLSVRGAEEEILSEHI
jgi:chromosome segregation ATPase